MTLSTLALFSAVAVIGLASVYFVICQRFDEGWIGNIVLGLLCLPAVLVILADLLAGRISAHDLRRAVLWLLVSCAYMLARYALRNVLYHWRGRLRWPVGA